MQVGAIGGAAYNPYIYNTNTVSRASLNRISGIGSDITSAKTDFSALASEENVNPLKKGESLDFAGIIEMQMQMSRLNASRIMKEPAQTAEEMTTQAAGLNPVTEATTNNAQETGALDILV